MTEREKLIDLISDIFDFIPWENIEDCADYLVDNGVTVRQPARPLEEWGEDDGDVLWWAFPVEEPPYVGSPLDAAWPGYHTHWVPLPEPPKGVK